MKNRRFLTRAAALAFAIVFLFTAAQAVRSTVYAQTEEGTSVTGWALEIDEMLAKGDYVEGEVLVVTDNSRSSEALLASAVGNDESCETLSTVSDEAVEETFDVDVSSKKADTEIKIISSLEKSTEQLLRELASDTKIIYASPNYISYETELEEQTYTQNVQSTESAEAESEESVNDDGVIAYEAAKETGENAEKSSLSAEDKTGEAAEEAAEGTKGNNLTSEGSNDTSANDDTEKAEEIEANASESESKDGSSAKNESDETTGAEIDTAQKTTAEASEDSLGENGAVTKLKITGTAEDIFDNQQYTSIGDLSYLQWAYHNNETSLYTINSPLWNEYGQNNINTSEDAVIAVIDSGIDYTHPEFDGIIKDMTEYSEKGGKYGYNCSGDGAEDEVMDDNGHGTHCAGIIAAKWDGTGTSGVSSGAKLCIVRASVGGSFATDSVVKAFQYLVEAVDNGLNLYSVNCSYGGPGSCNVQLLMINELGKRGVVTCVASGNSSNDNDDFSSTSGDYSTSPYAIMVNASNANYLPSDFTCYGQTTTDVFSPGDAILAPVSSQSATYVSMVDSNSKYYDGFGESKPESGVRINYIGTENVTTKKVLEFETLEEFTTFVDNTEKQQAGTRTANTESFDKDGYTCNISVPALESSDYRALYLVSVPVDSEDAASISNFSFALKSTLGSVQTWVRPIRFETVDETCVTTHVTLNGTTGWQRPSNVWTNMSVNMSENDNPCPYYNGRLYFVVLVSDVGGENEESTLYIDSVGSGNNVLRYAFYQGTSMACPAITGSTAVAYSILLQDGSLAGLTDSEKAIYVANTIKASVIPKDSYTLKCSSNGAFNFEVSEDDYTPVINTVSEDGEYLILKGQYFGIEEGTATVEGNACTIAGWTDTTVKLEIPEGTENGRVSLEITAANGKTATRKLIIANQSGKEKFENQVSLPSEISSCNIVSMTGLGGKLYVIPETVTDEYGKSVIQEELWSYDMDSGTWKQLSDIPMSVAAKTGETLQTASLTTYDGFIVASVIYVSEKEEEGKEERKGNEAYLYNPASGSWTELNLKNITIPMGGSFFGNSEGLFYYGGYTVKYDKELELEEKEPSYTIYRLEFDMPQANDASSGITVKKATEAGTLIGTYEDSYNVSTYEDTTLIVGQGVEWLSWSDADKKFTSDKFYTFPKEMSVIGKQGDPVCYIAGFAGAITPKGTIIAAFNGDNYVNRGYDTFYLSQDGSIEPFDKYASFSDLYMPISCYADGYLFVSGNTYFNEDSTIAYLAYTKLLDPEPEIVVEGGGTRVRGSGESLTFIADYDFDKFVAVTVDGDIVDTGNYDVKEGSTIVTLKAEYLDKLAAGTHTLGIIWTDASASTSFVLYDTAVEYAVIFDSCGGSEVSGQHHAKGEKIVKPADPVKSGYTFAGWYMDKTYTQGWNFDLYTVSGPTTLYAKWLAAGASGGNVPDTADGNIFWPYVLTGILALGAMTACFAAVRKRRNN